jgi:G3E family GTPase
VERPDVILAEPVGSCTDLVATVIQPLKDLYDGQFEVAPYAVLFKPSHGTRILRNQPAGGFSPKAAYIFKKQLEEADAIVINRIDELDPPQLEELSKLLAEHYPSSPLLKISAQTGQGFDALAELLEQSGGFGRRILDIDYDTYAEGEAELGWLNASVRLSSKNCFPTYFRNWPPCAENSAARWRT